MSRNNKSGGLRFLWIPGRKPHHKGRFNSTKKLIDYSQKQKRSEPWSLGGSRTQQNFLEAEASGDNLSTPTVSGLLITGATAVPHIASTEMPALTEKKFSVLANVNDNYQLPSPPKDGEKHNGNNNHISAGELISDSNSNHNLKKIDEDLEDDLPSPPSNEDHHHSDVPNQHSPIKKSSSINKRKSHNNSHPEVDVNSIESVSESKLQYSDLDITDGVYCNSHNNKNKKRKNKKNKQSKNNGKNEEEDEKIVKCLYYTLMCCECTIS